MWAEARDLATALDERVAWACARVRDDATVELLTATTPADVLAALRAEERAGRPTYGVAPAVAPRAVGARCRCCGAAVWVLFRRRLYCGPACKDTAYRRRRRVRDPGWRRTRTGEG